MYTFTLQNYFNYIFFCFLLLHIYSKIQLFYIQKIQLFYLINEDESNRLERNNNIKECFCRNEIIHVFILIYYSDYIETCDFLSENVPIVNDMRIKSRFSRMLIKKS